MAGKGRSGGDEMGFGGWNEPFGKGARDIRVFLETAGSNFLIIKF